jgi:hypothetical protein
MTNRRVTVISGAEGTLRLRRQGAVYAITA